jgi:2-dehydropantoate 2-reductase
MPFRYLVMGCGAVGGTIAAQLLESGQDVTAYSPNDAIADAVDSRGYQLRGDGPARSVAGRVVRAVPSGPFDVVILATPPTRVEAAATAAREALAPSGRVLCMQNGLCEERVAGVVGPERTIGAIVGWGAAMPEPGLYERTASGGFTLGRLDGLLGDTLEAIGRDLECIGPVEMTRNLAGKRWSKLAINCAISSLGTLSGERLGALLQHRFVRRVALEIMTEVVQVARRERVRLEKVSGTLDLDWIALTEEDQHASGSPSLVAKHALLYAVGLRFRRMRSSMLAAIERGREPAVDFLNGEVVERGKRHGVATPANARVRSLVWDVAQGRRRPAMDLLAEHFAGA